MADRLNAALRRSSELLEEPYVARSPEGTTRARSFAIGDPQTSHERLLRVLDAHRLLGDDGMLAPDAGLVSIGDHFDFGARPDEPEPMPAEVGAEGMRTLRWLAAHPPDQVVLLAGNHDLSRVQELGLETDQSFADARARALAIRAKKDAGEDTRALEAAFAERFPAIPTPELARRDYLSFTEAQRAFVQQLLVDGRLRLGHAARLSSGEPVLLTHAGITARELAMIGLDANADPHAIADALNAYLARAVDRVAGAWSRGERVQLDLAPLHVFGRSGREGGGLLYHRPARPGRPGSDAAWEFHPEAPRRYDPRALPGGLVQISGHSSHKKCRRELEGWVMPSAGYEGGGLRTLFASGDRVAYEGTIVPPREGFATMYLIDAEMNATEPARYDLLALAP